MVKSRHTEVQPTIATGQVDRFFASLADEYAAWQKDPLVGQPVYVPTKSATPELEQLQQEMALVLKLQRRTMPTMKSNFRTKVVTFQQAPKFIGQQKTAISVADPRDVYRELTDNAEGPWATRDVDGSLLLSSNTERLDELFGDRGQRFQRVRTDDSWRLAARLPDGRLMTAWLEENKELPTRPLVKFDFAAVNRPTPAKLPDGGQPGAELGLPVAVPPGAP
jgi:hypothetical protein